MLSAWTVSEREAHRMLKQRETFREILERVAAGNAATLEGKARQASWLAHSQPVQKRRFFAIKHRQLSRLFTVLGYEPIIQGCECARQGLILSLRLRATWGLLHVPLNQLEPRAHKYIVNPRSRLRRSESTRPPISHLAPTGRHISRSR